ncbi:MAG: hypothetical protein VW547_02145 [Alphaproteobacteria bacterium]
MNKAMVRNDGSVDLAGLADREFRAFNVTGEDPIDLDLAVGVDIDRDLHAVAED